MKQLFNFANIPQMPTLGLTNPVELQSFLKSKKLDGVEIFVYDNSIDNSIFKKYVIGCHLQYWPCWLPIYENNSTLLKSMFKNQAELQAFYGAVSYEGWLEVQRRNIEKALSLEPEYLVWHVADNTIDELFFL